MSIRALLLVITSALPLAAFASTRSPTATVVRERAVGFPMTCQISLQNQTSLYGAVAYVGVYRSLGPASSGLTPGQCAFEDRAIRPDELRPLCFPGTITSITFRGTYIVDASQSPTTFGGPGAAVLRAVVAGPTKLVNVMVHAGMMGGVSCWIVDKFGV